MPLNSQTGYKRETGKSVVTLEITASFPKDFDHTKTHGHHSTGISLSDHVRTIEGFGLQWHDEETWRYKNKELVITIRAIVVTSLVPSTQPLEEMILDNEYLVKDVRVLSIDTLWQ